MVILVAAFLFYESKLEYKGLPITIEYKKGEVRSGIDVDGNYWEQEMFCDYGYFDSIIGFDGKELDVYYNTDNYSEKIFRVSQLKVDTQEFDEYKIMLGFNNIRDAAEAYLAHYPDNWKVFGGIEEITLKELE